MKTFITALFTCVIATALVVAQAAFPGTSVVPLNPGTGSGGGSAPTGTMISTNAPASTNTVATPSSLAGTNVVYRTVDSVLGFTPVNKAGDTMTGALVLPNTSGALAFTNDVFLQRGAANTLALRNGANAQAFNIYNTYTDASNYESAQIGWIQTANTFSIRTAKAGTGSSRGIDIRAQGILFLGGNDTVSWTIPTTGHLLAQSDNTYDIGASGATRPRNVYVANNVVSGNAVTTPATGSFYMESRFNVKGPSDGVVTLLNTAQTDFNRLQLGGTSSSFPAIKRNGTSLSVRLADDSADGVLVIPNKTPSSSSETNYVGAISYDADYIYVWTATNVNKRAALTTW